MELLIRPLFLTSKSTISELSIDGVDRMFTLELPVKDGLPGSAIPPGRYQVVLQPSPKFLAQAEDVTLPEDYRQFVAKYASKMPHIICPPRSLIMFHWGNTPENTEGCVLTGLTHAQDEVGESRLAYDALFEEIEGPAASGTLWVTVTRDRDEKDQWP